MNSNCIKTELKVFAPTIYRYMHARGADKVTCTMVDNFLDSYKIKVSKDLKKKSIPFVLEELEEMFIERMK